MAEKHSLEMQVRTVLGKKVKTLRQQGLMPATVYGKGVAPISVQVPERAFGLVYRKAGRTALVELTIPGQPLQSAFVQEVQRHPITRNIIHADFRVVDLKQALNVEVPVLLVGESPLAKRGDGLVTHGLNTVEVRALPANIPQHIEVDVSVLDDLDKSIYVRDLPKSDVYTILTDGDELVAAIVPVGAAEPEPEAEETPAEPELIRRGKKDDEEGGEG